MTHSHSPDESDAMQQLIQVRAELAGVEHTVQVLRGGRHGALSPTLHDISSPAGKHMAGRAGGARTLSPAPHGSSKLQSSPAPQLAETLSQPRCSTSSRRPLQQDPQYSSSTAGPAWLAAVWQVGSLLAAP